MMAEMSIFPARFFPPKTQFAQKIQHQPLVLLPEICYTNMVCLDRCAHLARPGRFIIRRIHLEKLTYTHNDAAAKVLAAYYETPPLAYVRSYGCQQNVNDGEKIKGVLQDVGYGLCDNVEHADLILFNTCAVREHAEQRVFGNVGALKKLKEQNPRLMIGICGCMAQQEHIVEKLRQSYPYVDLVFGVDGIDRLPAMLAERIRKGKRYLEKPEERNAVVEELPIRRDSGFRAWLPIMYGCDNFCTYCLSLIHI